MRVGTFAEAAAFGEVLFNATHGAKSLEALNLAGDRNLNGKVLVDIANPLDFSKGMPPSLLVSNTDSLGEQIQRAFPQVKVVKALNTVTANIMVYPQQIAHGDHQVFVSGNDAGAKAQVVEILKSFGWTQILDLGDITTARGTEMYLPLWLRLWGAQRTVRRSRLLCRIRGLLTSNPAHVLPARSTHGFPAPSPPRESSA